MKYLSFLCTKWMENCEAMTSSTHSFAYSYGLVKKCFLKICETSKFHNFLIFQPIFIRFSLFCSENFTLSSEIKLDQLRTSPLTTTVWSTCSLCLNSLSACEPASLLVGRSFKTSRCPNFKFSDYDSVCEHTCSYCYLHNNWVWSVKEELHTRILKNLKEREKYSLQNSAKMMKIG